MSKMDETQFQQQFQRTFIFLNATLVNWDFNKLISEGFWVLVGHSFSIIGSLLFIKIVTHNLTPSIFGTVSLFVSVSTFFSQVFYGGLGSGIARYFSIADENQDIAAYIKSCKKIINRTSFFIVLFGGLICVFLLISKKESVLYITIITIFVSIINGINSVINNLQNAARKRVFVAINNGCSALSKIFLSLLFFKIFGPNETTLINAILMSSIIALFTQLYFIKKNRWNIIDRNKKNKTNKIDWSKNIWKYSFSVILWSGFMAIYQLSDKWALEYNSTRNDVGLYAIIYQLGYSPTLLLMANFLAFISPIIFQKAGEGRDCQKNKNINKVILKIIFFTLFFSFTIAAASFFYHKKIFLFFVGINYSNYSYTFPFLVLAAGIFSAGQILNLQMESRVLVKEMISVKIFTSIFGVAFNFLLSAFWGIHGLIAAQILYSLLFFSGMIFVSRKN